MNDEAKELAEKLIKEYEEICANRTMPLGEIAPGDFEALARVALEFCEEREGKRKEFCRGQSAGRSR